MIIKLSHGTGSGPTKLAAFDAALNNAGVANYNLIRLSSVIPAGSKVKLAGSRSQKLAGEWGDRLYAVYAEMRVDTPGSEAWAGIGWAQDKKSGKGLFVEHEGSSEKFVRESIKASLNALMATRNINYSPINMELTGITCKKDPVCALVVAAYKTSGWNNNDLDA